MAGHIHGHRTADQQGLGLYRLGPFPQCAANPGQQFFNGKGLGDIVIGAHVQTGHLVHNRVPGRQHDDRHGAFPAQTADHFHTGQLRQHDVQQHQIKLAAEGQLQTGAAIGSLADGVALMTQLQFQKPGDGLFVFYN